MPQPSTRTYYPSLDGRAVCNGDFERFQRMWGLRIWRPSSHLGVCMLGTASRAVLGFPSIRVWIPLYLGFLEGHDVVATFHDSERATSWYGVDFAHVCLEDFGPVDLRRLRRGPSFSGLSQGVFPIGGFKYVIIFPLLAVVRFGYVNFWLGGRVLRWGVVIISRLQLQRRIFSSFQIQ